MEENVTGKRLEKLREARGYSKQKLSEMVGMKSYTSITGWENGSSLPRGREIIKLCKIFNVSSDYLLGLSDEM